MTGFRLTSMVVALALAACGPSERSDEDFDRASEGAAEVLSDASFEDVGDTSLCTQDCSGHAAGFEWARDHGVTDVAECSGDSQSFVEGCEAYAEALDTAAEEQVEEGE